MKRNTALKIAASLALIFVCLYSIKFFQNDATTFVAANEVVTVYLPDSTKVWLNAHSQLSYTDDFNSRDRNITLQGEAFFEVKRDTLRPFIVSTGFSTTRVLGTSFNLHENDSNTILTVAEGVVRFSSERNQANGDGAIALANEKVVYKHESHTILKTKNDKRDFASWRERNNPQYERERTQPAKFLTNSYTWRKNPINQSKIEGRITNSASLVTYSQIVMKVSYVNNNGKQTTTHVTVFDKVQPGQTIEYTKRLLDIFTDTKSLQVEIVTAEIATDAGY